MCVCVCAYEIIDRISPIPFRFFCFYFLFCFFAVRFTYLKNWCVLASSFSGRRRDGWTGGVAVDGKGKVGSIVVRACDRGSRRVTVTRISEK